MPTTKEVLERATEIISTNWANGGICVDKDDLASIPFTTDDPDACYCAVGAVARARWELEGKPELPVRYINTNEFAYSYADPFLYEVRNCLDPEFLESFENETNNYTVWNFNDKHYHNTPIVEVFSCAIDAIDSKDTD